MGRRRINRERIIERPAWVRHGMTVAYDFANGRYFGFGRQFNTARLTCTRASTADYAEDNRGWLRTFPAATPRVTNKGLLIETAATNVLLRCRDLTQAAWTKTNTTAALDQIGVDRSNSASSITATSGNATVLQAVTLASSSRRVSAYVKRLTGTGVVNMTTDGGSTWIAVTVTADWSRVDIPVQTVTNPSTGFQIVISGDAIAVDFVQNETGPIVTSPILTGAASATRSLDVVKFAFLPPFYNPLEGTLWAEVLFSQVNSGGAAQTIVAFDLQSGSSASRIHLSLNNTGVGNFAVVDAGVTQASVGLGAFSANVITRCGAAWAANDFISFISSFLGTNDTSGTIPPLVNQLHFGDNTGTSPMNGFIRQIQYSPRRLPNAVLQSISR